VQTVKKIAFPEQIRNIIVFNKADGTIPNQNQNNNYPISFLRKSWQFIPLFLQIKVIIVSQESGLLADYF